MRHPARLQAPGSRLQSQRLRVKAALRQKGRVDYWGKEEETQPGTVVPPQAPPEGLRWPSHTVFLAYSDHATSWIMRCQVGTWKWKKRVCALALSTGLQGIRGPDSGRLYSSIISQMFGWPGLHRPHRVPQSPLGINHLTQRPTSSPALWLYQPQDPKEANPLPRPKASLTLHL